MGKVSKRKVSKRKFKLSEITEKEFSVEIVAQFSDFDHLLLKNGLFFSIEKNGIEYAAITDPTWDRCLIVSRSVYQPIWKLEKWVEGLPSTALLEI